MMKRVLTAAASLALVAACSSGSDEPQPPVGKAEDDATECRDGVDNDEDGRRDCLDSDCKLLDICRGDGNPELGLAKCQDGIDNDNNSFTDCEDFSCSKSTDQEVLDYCASIDENTLEKCSDGADNDDNGHTDCQDYSCSKSTDQGILDYCASR